MPSARPLPVDEARRLLVERGAARVRTFTSPDGLAIEEYALAPDGRFLFLMQRPATGGWYVLVLRPASGTGMLEDELEAIRRA